MKIAVIDIGSNSVRLMLWADGKTLYKEKKTTRLGEGVQLIGNLLPEAIERSAQAVAHFFKKSKSEGAEKVYAFATAAVRSAQNGYLFVNRVKELCGLEIDVISGEQEAQIGVMGALGDRDGGIIDVGGASAEITVRFKGETVFSKSVNVGTVRLFEIAGRDKASLERAIDEKIAQYGECDFSNYDMYAIGGTATRLGAVKNALKTYDPEIISGTVLTLGQMRDISDKLLSMSVEEIRATTLCVTSADIVGGGALLMRRIMEKFSIDKITVSESDNLEGYAVLKEGEI